MTLEGVLLATLAYSLPLLGAIVGTAGWVAARCRGRS